MAVSIRIGLYAGAASMFALLMAGPAAAQYRGAPYPAPVYQTGGIDARIGQLRLRLDAELRRGTISRGEAAALRARLDEITRLQRFYLRNGLNSVEQVDLERRLRDFQLAMRNASDRDGRYGRYDDDRDDDYRDDDRYRDDDDDRRGNSYGRRDMDDDDDDYRGDERLDRDRDGWDDRDRDRDGRWRDDVSSGAGVDVSIGMLRVGQRATANLGGVPYEYRDRYRDGGGVYYRSDGRAIYQIDARTNAVIRVYPIGR